MSLLAHSLECGPSSISSRNRPAPFIVSRWVVGLAIWAAFGPDLRKIEFLTSAERSEGAREYVPI